jgi:hypothetical protein
MDGATLDAYQEMLRAIRFVLEAKLFCLKWGKKYGKLKSFGLW